MKIIQGSYKFFLKALFLMLQGICVYASAQTDISKVSIIEKYVVGYDEVLKMKFINDAQLYSEGWQELPQAKFWQQIMNLRPDSAIVSIAANRKVLDKISVKDWNKLNDVQHNLYRDSIRKINNIADSINVLITPGHKDF